MVVLLQIHKYEDQENNNDQYQSFLPDIYWYQMIEDIYYFLNMIRKIGQMVKIIHKTNFALLKKFYTCE